MFKKIYDRIRSHITPKRAGMAGIVLLIVILSCVSAITTHNDRARYNTNERVELITRVPAFRTEMLWGEPPKSVIRLSWYDNTVKLEGDVQTELQLDAKLYPDLLPDNSLKFSSSSEEVAAIDGTGKITIKKPGNVEFLVENEYTRQQTRAYLHIIRPVTGVMLEKSTIDLYTTDMGMRLAAETVPADASNTTLKWFSKDPEIVTVDQTGHLTPGKTGLTEVVVTSVDGGFTAKCFVNVINQVIKAESVEILNKEDGLTLAKGGKWTGIAAVKPSNARYRSVQWSSSDTNVATVNREGVVTAVGEGTAEITASSPDGPSDHITLTVSGGAVGGNIDLNPSYTVSGGIKYTAYAMSLDSMTDLQQSFSPKYSDDSGFGSATRDQTRMYLDPNAFGAGPYKYQFMDLSYVSGINRDSLAAFLEGKGVLSGKADVFIAAARQYNVSEIYLAVHACLETGSGTSQLATGVTVNGTKVYNMYGIGAYDNTAVSSGSSKAYREGWTSVDAAIMGGAKWISEQYVNNPQYHQNTLYKMRWNPAMPGEHQYATDVTWAVMQSVTMEKLIAQIPGVTIAYDIPVYAGSSALEIGN